MTMLRFSRRLDWDLPPNRLARAVADRRKRGEEVLDLTVSNPTAVGLGSDEARLRALLAPSGCAAYRPAPLGLPEARTAIAAELARGGADVRPEDLVLTASTSEAYAFVFKALADPGDRVLVPRPSYPLFDELAAVEGLVPVGVPLRYDGGWRIDPAEVEARLDARTRAILLVHPNNPTGSYLKGPELAALEELAARHGLALVVDEVFYDYPLEDDRERAPTTAGRRGPAPILALGGLSKLAGLPQVKLSWIVLGGPEPARVAIRRRLERIADLFLDVATPVQLAAPALFALGAERRRRIAARIAANLARLDAALGALPAADRLRVEGGWSAVVRLPAVEDGEAWALRLLDEAGVLVHPGYLFDFETEAHLVVSLLPEERRFAAALDRLVAVVGRRLAAAAAPERADVARTLTEDGP